MISTLALFLALSWGLSELHEPIIGSSQRRARHAAMGIEQIFTTKTVVTFIAVGVLALIAFALIRAVVSRGLPVVWEILRVTTGLVCMGLAALSGRGNIGPWGRGSVLEASLRCC